MPGSDYRDLLDDDRRERGVFGLFGRWRGLAPPQHVEQVGQIGAEIMTQA